MYGKKILDVCTVVPCSIFCKRSKIMVKYIIYVYRVKIRDICTSHVLLHFLYGTKKHGQICTGKRIVRRMYESMKTDMCVCVYEPSYAYV